MSVTYAKVFRRAALYQLLRVHEYSCSNLREAAFSCGVHANTYDITAKYAEEFMPAGMTFGQSWFGPPTFNNRTKRVQALWQMSRIAKKNGWRSE